MKSSLQTLLKSQQIVLRIKQFCIRSVCDFTRITYIGYLIPKHKNNKEHLIEKIT